MTTNCKVKRTSLPTTATCLSSSELTNILRELCFVLSPCVGPRGGIKVLQTESDMLFTASSKQIIKYFELDNNVIVKFIISAVRTQLKSYSDCGLCTCLFTANLLREFFSSDITAKRSVFEFLVSLFQRVVSDDNGISVDVSSMSHLLAVVSSVIYSKSSVPKMENLNVRVLEAFLKSVNDDQLGTVNVFVDSGVSADPQVVNGLFYPEPDIETVFYQRWLRENANKNEFAVIIFGIMLTGVSENEEIITGTKFKYETTTSQPGIEYLLKLCTVIIQSGVQIVANQKVIDPVVKHHLEANNILVLERLGTDQALALSELTGAKLLGSTHVNEYDIGCCKGTLTKVISLLRNSRWYLSLENCDVSYVTLMVRAWSERDVEEQKILCSQSLSTLGHVLRFPTVVPGAGCYEATLIAKFIKAAKCANHSFKPHEYQPAIQWFTRSLYQLCKNITKSTSMHIDTKYFHLWRNETAATCACKMIKKTDDVKLELFLFENVESLVSFYSNSNKLYDFDANCIVDLFVAKRSALKLAVETAGNVCNIGYVIQC